MFIPHVYNNLDFINNYTWSKAEVDGTRLTWAKVDDIRTMYSYLIIMIISDYGLLMIIGNISQVPSLFSYGI